ncbi:hypothetical protein DXG03_001376 [Asterophora parasitica]|uniref:SET domain-containing protein n=1 Tax=Asterophora parasitica TaxID=117018 RepID=A0A9P7G343_9AGAR|nr:hypothetical protein DXG03_001376 [Asterophora parasitica]
MKRGFLNKPNTKPPGRHAALADSDNARAGEKVSTSNVAPKAFATGSKLGNVGPAAGKVPSKLDSRPVVIPRTTKPAPEVPLSGNIRGIVGTRLDMRIASLPLTGHPKTLCLLFPGAKEGIDALPGFPAPLPTISPLDLPYYTGRNPRIVAGNRGVYAKVDFEPGDNILFDRPLLLFPAAMPDTRVQNQAEEFLKTMVGHLDPMTREMFYTLHNCKSNDPKSVRGIVDTNALGIGGLPGSYTGAYAVVGGIVSRLNHSCLPNAEYKWDLLSLALYVRAVRPIKKDEQICISYCDLLQPRAQRRKELQLKYSFKCDCPSCSLPDDKSAQSDARRKDLLKSRRGLTDTKDFLGIYETQLEKWVADPSIPENFLLTRSEDCLLMMEFEGVYDEGVWFMHAEILAKVLCALEKRTDAVFLAEKAAAMSKAFTGKDGGWGKVAEAPEKTAWWGRRKRLAAK